MRRICALGAVLAFLAGGLLAGGMAGAAKKETAKVYLGVGFVTGTGYPFFQGSIHSSKNACKAHRDIHIVFQRNRGKTTYIGRTRTDSGGGYFLYMRKGLRTGGYFARAKKKGGCAARHSGVLAVDHNTSAGVPRNSSERHR